MFSQKKQLFLFGVLALLILAIPITVILLQRPHEIRSRANSSLPLPATVCAVNPLDIILIIDRSGSMNDKIGTGGTTKIQAAIAAAQKFVDLIAAGNSNTRIGLVTFATTASLDSKLTTNYASVKTMISKITASGDTCHQCAARTTNQEIHTNGRANVQKVAIFLTDGIANTIIGHIGKVPPAQAEQAALTEILSGFKADGTNYYTIGLGNDVNASFLQKIAADTNAQYYFSPTTAQLTAIYQHLTQILGKGAILGSLFNDLDNNGASDSGEPALPGWTVDLAVGTAGSTPIAKAQTDASGNYAFDGLCDGSYFVSQEVQQGWTQTDPTTPHTYYIVTITKGNTQAGNVFGDAKRACGTACAGNINCTGASNSCTSCINNTCQINYCGKPCTSNAQCGAQGSNCGVCDVNGSKTCVSALSPTATPTATPTPTQTSTCGITCQSDSDCQGNGSACTFCDINGTHKCVASLSPTATPTPGAMSVGLDILLHAIGNGGDNATTSSSLSNKNPLHPQRAAEVFIYDTNNQQVADKIGTVTYSSASGSFKGTIDLGTTVGTGQYYIKIQSDFHLRKLEPGIVTLTSGIINPLPQVSLVAGDADGDNALTLLDYNLLLGCYSDLLPAKACTPQWQIATDFNDDGKVDGIDYNLFLRELSVQNGE